MMVILMMKKKFWTGWRFPIIWKWPIILNGLIEKCSRKFVKHPTIWLYFSVRFKTLKKNRKLHSYLYFIHFFLIGSPFNKVSEDCKQCPRVLAEIEHIDDEADGAGINFVKIDDKKMAKEFGVFALPAILFFRQNSKEPVIYAGESGFWLSYLYFHYVMRKVTNRPNLFTGRVPVLLKFISLKIYLNKTRVEKQAFSGNKGVNIVYRPIMEVGRLGSKNRLPSKSRCVRYQCR